MDNGECFIIDDKHCINENLECIDLRKETDQAVEPPGTVRICLKIKISPRICRRLPKYIESDLELS